MTARKYSRSSTLSAKTKGNLESEPREPVTMPLERVVTRDGDPISQASFLLQIAPFVLAVDLGAIFQGRAILANLLPKSHE